MRGKDDGLPAPGYVTWDSRDQPDYAGAYVTGLVGSLVSGSVVVQSEFDAPSLVTLYEVDFTSLANQTLGDAGSTPTIDGRTWYQVSQAAGVPTHSQIVNGTGLVVTNSGSTGTYRLGIRFADVDPGFTADPRQQRYEVWMLGARSGTPAGASVYGAFIGDSTNATLYVYGVGFEGGTPSLEYFSFATGFAIINTAASNAHDVFHLSMMNRYAFEGRYGDSSGGQFPGYDGLTLMAKHANRMDPVSTSVLAAGVMANNVAGPVMTYTRMKIVKISGV